ncbi:MAG TPA: DUF1385 domain-containing protein [Pseudobacteroides sp.]|uniref:DUF1385 domain-containing protein n=1 Tax=Pseudobacteroides sp. TaxID=1968840 RepID=UPI002F933702
MHSYLAFVSKAKDIRRVWQYHSAEHKTINCYENGNELAIENVIRYSAKSHSRLAALISMPGLSNDFANLSRWREKLWYRNTPQLFTT